MADPTIPDPTINEQIEYMAAGVDAVCALNRQRKIAGLATTDIDAASVRFGLAILDSLRTLRGTEKP